MEHTHIVTANELQSFADTRAAEEVIPELIWLLVTQSVPDLTVCRIPYGDAINQPGLDGLVETETGFRQFVPQYRSYWEIGRGNDPQDKATSDFKKRTKATTHQDRLQAKYVFVTPRSAGAGGWSLPAQQKWIARRKRFDWADIKILDGGQIADWLREFPAIGKWLLKKIGLVKGVMGFETPAEHWELLQPLGLPPAVFLANRDNARDQLLRLFNGEINDLALAVESEFDSEDFIAAFLESLPTETRHSFANRCLFINDAEAWHSMANLRSRHVLVAHPRLDLEYSGEKLHLAARQKAHGVIIAVSGRMTQGGSNLVPLRSPSKSFLEQILQESGFEAGRARELAGAGALNLAALKRYLRGLGEAPPYAAWESARILAQACLLGRWSGLNPADQAAAEILLGKSYGEWIETARPEILRSDTPLSQLDEVWKVISRGEAWIALGPRLSDDDLDRFQKLAVVVLGGRDPKFDLPPSEHYRAAIKGKTLTHSAALREGIAETLALLGSKPQALASCRQGKAESVAAAVVRDLLWGATWDRWASLNQQLPMLAEAAPGFFLDCVEAALAQPSESPFLRVFAQESNSFGGGTYISGLLWALETLAWYPDFLARVTLILGELAAIDPGGTWGNRPANSLATIFLPWYPQTCASIEKRRVAVETLLREQPGVGWKLLMALLPSMHGYSSGSAKPTWREFISQEWKDGASQSEYWQQVEGYASLATGIAAMDMSRLTELIDRLPDLPPPAFTRVLEHLGSKIVTSLPESTRLPLWEALTDLVAKHRRFSDAEWAMKPPVITGVEEAADKLAPKSSPLLHRRLFSDRDFDLYEETDDYEEQRRNLEGCRQRAIRELFDESQIAGVLEFTQQVDSPWKAGFAFGSVEEEGVDGVLLPNYLGKAEQSLIAFINGFILGRFYAFGWNWADSQLGKSWTAEQVTNFLVSLPFQAETWLRADQVLASEAGHYWQRANVNPWGLPAETLIAPAEKLLQWGRPRAALECLYVLTHKKADFPPELAVRALMESLSTENTSDRFDLHGAEELIQWLQENSAADVEKLFRIEWNYLPLLRHCRGGCEPRTLERRLATDPGFFCEVIGTVFRSDKESKGKCEYSEQEKNISKNAYRLLHGWRTLPGTKADKSFDGAAFSAWLLEVKKRSSESGHFRVAMSQVGQALPNSPPDPDGLWVHNSVAAALDAKDAAELRSGFTTGLFNKRGVHSFSAGEEERNIATGYRIKAEALESRGYPRLAYAVRKLAETYEHEAEQESRRNPFDD